MTASTPISVITPAFNAQRWLPRLTRSILGQTHREFEWLVVDDCSRDATYDLIREAADQDSRIRAIRLAENGGVANARNVGLREAIGDFVCFIDADDVWDERKLEVQHKFMVQHGVRVSCMDYYRVDDEGRRLSKVSPPALIRLSDMLVSNRIGNLSGMVRRTDVRGLEFEKTGHEDYVFWLEVLRRTGSASRVPTTDALCSYTVHDASISANKLKAAGWQWNIYRRILGLGIAQSAWYFCGYAWHGLRKRA